MRCPTCGASFPSLTPVQLLGRQRELVLQELGRTATVAGVSSRFRELGGDPALLRRTLERVEDRRDALVDELAALDAAIARLSS